MKQRGRKSVNLLALPIDASPPRLSAPKDLTKIERSLFDFIVDASPPLHFAVSDTPLLVSYVQACLMARSAAKPPTKAAIFERVVRLQAMLATKLRLSPQTRLNPETLARQQFRSERGGSLGEWRCGMREKTRGERNADWIERYCLVPHGPDKGKRVRLTEAEHHIVRQIYDGANGPQDVPISAPLSAYLALLHLCGPEGKQHAFRPGVNVDVFTLWNAAGPHLRAVLKRKGESIVCAGLGAIRRQHDQPFGFSIASQIWRYQLARPAI